MTNFVLCTGGSPCRSFTLDVGHDVSHVAHTLVRNVVEVHCHSIRATLMDGQSQLFKYFSDYWASDSLTVFLSQEDQSVDPPNRMSKSQTIALDKFPFERVGTTQHQQPFYTYATSSSAAFRFVSNLFLLFANPLLWGKVAQSREFL